MNTSKIWGKTSYVPSLKNQQKAIFFRDLLYTIHQQPLTIVSTKPYPHGMVYEHFKDLGKNKLCSQPKESTKSNIF